MRRQTVYLLSDMRSGSTLLDQLLGAHPAVISLGEMHWLPAYASQDRSMYDPDHELVCTCGQAVPDCPFWTSIASGLGRTLESLRLRPRYNWLNKRLITRFPGLFRRSWLRSVFFNSEYMLDTLALTDAIFRVADRSIVLDSSKSTLRFRAALDARPLETRGVILTRDYRAVVYSKMKRGNSLESAAIGWRNKMREIAALTCDLPDSVVHRLSYEGLCRDPSIELARLCKFLGLVFVSAMLNRSTSESHHIGGSPSKFDPARTAISMDTTYEDAFTPSQHAVLAALVEPEARQWGY